MGKDIGCFGQTIRIVFILINIFFVAIGFALLGLGIYLVVVGENYEFVTRNEYASAAPILIVCGAITAIVSIFGVIGALGLWWPLIMIYVIVVMIVIVLEVVAGILGFVFRTQVAEHYSQALNTTVEDFRSVNASDFQNDVNGFVDYVQSTFDCCGIGSPDNWLSTPFYNDTRMFPDSCECNDLGDDNCIMFNSQMVYEKGCNDSLFDFIENNAAIIGGVGLAFGLIEVVGAVFGIILCACVIRAKKEEKDSWAL